MYDRMEESMHGELVQIVVKNVILVVKFCCNVGDNNLINGIFILA